MGTTSFDINFTPDVLEEIKAEEGVDAYHAGINASHIRSVYQNIPAELNLLLHKFGNYFTIMLADALCENTSLESVCLEMNHIGDRGAKALAWALSMNHSILKIDLSNNNIGSEGIRALAHGPMRQNRSIVSWNLSENMRRRPPESFHEVKAVYREVIASLRTSKCLLYYQGPYANELEDTIKTNRVRAEMLAAMLVQNLITFSADQIYDLQESYGAVIYTLKESGYSREQIVAMFNRQKKAAAEYHCRITMPTIPEIRESDGFLKHVSHNVPSRVSEVPLETSRTNKKRVSS